MEEVQVRTLLSTPILTVRDVTCPGTCRHRSEEECTTDTRLVFPYRGVYIRHVGRDDAVAEANQVLFFNAREGYRISHPVTGGDTCLDLAIDDAMLHELAPKQSVREGKCLTFVHQRLRIDPRAQALVALLRHGLHKGVAEPLEAESLALVLAHRAVGPRTSHAGGASWSKGRLLHELQHGLPYRTIEPLPPGRTINWHDPEVERSLDVEASEVTLTEVTIRRRSVMTTIRTAAVTLLALGSLSAIDVRPSAAEIYRPWCVVYQGSRDGATSCAFTSFAQCMMTGGPGTGGSCVQNPWYLAYGERGPAVATTGQGGRVRRR